MLVDSLLEVTNSCFIDNDSKGDATISTGGGGIKHVIKNEGNYFVGNKVRLYDKICPLNNCLHIVDMAGCHNFGTLGEPVCCKKGSVTSCALEGFEHEQDTRTTPTTTNTMSSSLYAQYFLQWNGKGSFLQFRRACSV